MVKVLKTQRSAPAARCAPPKRKRIKRRSASFAPQAIAFAVSVRLLW